MEKVSSSNSQGVRVPKLRFPGFEGEWKEIFLSEFSQFLPGLTYKPEDVKTDGKLVLRSSNIQHSRLDFNDNVYVDSSIVPDRIRTHSNDVLMCVRNGSKSLVGKTALISDEHSDLAWGAFMTVLRPNTSNTLLYHYLNSPSFRKQVFPDLETATVKQITMSTLNRIKLLVPNKDEQDKVSDFLSALDKRIEKQRQLVEALKSYKRGALSKLFPQKGETSPRYRFAGFTEPWEQRKLGEICQITMGQSPDGSTYSDTPSDYILVQGNADLKDGWVFPRIWTTQKTKTADTGDLIMSVRAPAGAMGKTAYEVVLGRGVAGIKGNEFVFQTLVKMDGDGYWKKLAAGSTFESINSDVVMNAEIMVPQDVEEQREIGACLAALDHFITLHQCKLNEFDSVKTGLLQQMFI